MGTLLTVVGGCLRAGAAAASFSQRSRAAVSVTVAMIRWPPISGVVMLLQVAFGVLKGDFHLPHWSGTIKFTGKRSLR